MKLTIDRAELARLSGIAAGAASNRAINPILKNLGLVVGKKSVQLISTDMSRFVHFELPAEVEEPGDLVVDANLFSTYVGFLDSNKIVITGKDKIEVVGNQTAHFQTADYSDFPIMPKAQGVWHKLDRKILEDILSKVGFSVGDQTSKAILQNLYFGEGLVVATDSHKTAILEVDLGLKETCLLSPVGLGIIKNLSGDIEVNLSGNWAFFKGSNGMVGVISSQGNFPNIKGFLDKWKAEKPSTVLTLNKASLLQILQITDFFISRSKDVTNISLIWDNKTIRVKLDIPELTQFDNTVQGKVKGKSGSIRFRPNLLLQGVQVIEDDKVIVSIYDSNKPILVQDEKRKDWTYLIMPVADAEAVANWEKEKADSANEQADEEDFE